MSFSDLLPPNWILTEFGFQRQTDPSALRPRDDVLIPEEIINLLDLVLPGLTFPEPELGRKSLLIDTSSSIFVYTEDRDIETGHGWRDRAGVWWGKNSFLPIFEKENQAVVSPVFNAYWRSPKSSYAWITKRESWERSGCEAADELRASDIQKVHPKFKGGDDMEGHFEFRMSPKKMRKYLEGLGIFSTRTLQR